MPTILLKAKDFATEITIYNAKQKNMSTETQISDEHITNNVSVRETLVSRGIVPEDIAPEPDIKKIERKIISEDKKSFKESPYYKIVEALKKHKAVIHSFDPHIKDKSSVKSLEALLKKSEAIILVTNHREFEVLTGELLKKHGVRAIIDGKNFLNKDDIKKSGVIYKGIGR